MNGSQSKYLQFLSNKYVFESKTPQPFTPIKTYDDKVTAFKRENILKGYNVTMRKDMLVIIPFFNPCNSVRIVQNLMFVKNKLDVAGISHVIIHCLFPDSEPIFDDGRTYLTVFSDSYAFVKENLANIAISKYNQYAKYLVLDGDVVFEDLCWYDKLSHMLDDVDVVQPFSKYVNLSGNFVDVLSSGYGMFYSKKNEESATGHPGFSIAFTKKFLDKHGYPDLNLIGGGDTMICSLILKEPLFSNNPNNKHYQYIYDKFVTEESITFSYLEGTVYHLYHNHVGNRQYTTRYSILNKYAGQEKRQTIEDITYKNEFGVYEWIPELREELNVDMLNYFFSRQDDEFG